MGGVSLDVSFELLMHAFVHVQTHADVITADSAWRKKIDSDNDDDNSTDNDVT